MARIGIIAAGHIGGTLARLFTRAGHDVIVANSRGPETLAELVSELGPSASSATAADAALRGEVLVVSVPLAAYADVPVEGTAGKVVIDTNNYYPQRDGHIGELGDVERAAAAPPARRARREVLQPDPVGAAATAAVPRATPSASRSPSPATTRAPRRSLARSWTTSATTRLTWVRSR